MIKKYAAWGAVVAAALAIATPATSAAADRVPLEEPAGGPYFGELDPSARSYVTIDNTGDGIGDAAYRWSSLYAALAGKSFVGPDDEPFFIDLGALSDGGGQDDAKNFGTYAMGPEPAQTATTSFRLPIPETNRTDIVEALLTGIPGLMPASAPRSEETR